MKPIDSRGRGHGGARRARVATLWAVPVLYAAACALPACASPFLLLADSLVGAQCLWVGPGLFGVGPTSGPKWACVPAWLANAVLFCGWVALAARGETTPALAGCLCLLLALPFTVLWFPVLLPGAYVWLASFGTLAVGSTLRLFLPEEPPVWRPSRWR